jgi:hypothetical protein
MTTSQNVSLISTLIGTIRDHMEGLQCKSPRKAGRERRKSSKKDLLVLESMKAGLERKIEQNTTYLDKSAESIVEFEPASFDEVRKVVDRQVREGEEWFLSSEVSIAVAQSIVQALTQKFDLTDPKRPKAISSEGLWLHQIQSVTYLLCSRFARSIPGLCWVLGNFWLNWDSKVLAELNSKIRAYPSHNVSFALEKASSQAMVMQFFELVRYLIQQFPDEFEYTPNMIILFTKLCCSKLPGISLIPLLDETGSAIPVPKTIESLTEIQKLVQNHQSLMNLDFIPSYSTDNQEIHLLLPGWNQAEFARLTQVYETWTISSSSYLLEELLRYEKERQGLAEKILDAEQRLRGAVHSANVMNKFCSSLTDVTELILPAPEGFLTPSSSDKRKRAKTTKSSDTSVIPKLTVEKSEQPKNGPGIKLRRSFSSFRRD